MERERHTIPLQYHYHNAKMRKSTGFIELERARPLLLGKQIFL
jgi:hypothetical protein